MERYKKHQIYLTHLLRPYYGFSNEVTGKKLGVTGATVANWRKKYHIPRGSLFTEHFEEKYGPGSTEDFRELIQRGESYAYIGRVFGISREAARQIAVKHFGHTRKAHE